MPTDTHTHTYTHIHTYIYIHTYTDKKTDLIICPMLWYSNGTDNDCWKWNIGVYLGPRFSIANADRSLLALQLKLVGLYYLRIVLYHAWWKLLRFSDWGRLELDPRTFLRLRTSTISIVPGIIIIIILGWEKIKKHTKKFEVEQEGWLPPTKRASASKIN